MTYAQSRALIALAESGGTGADVSAGQLAKAADLHPATVTAMLDLLEDEGLVVRRRSDDRPALRARRAHPRGSGAAGAQARRMACALGRDARRHRRRGHRDGGPGHAAASGDLLRPVS